MQIQRKRPTTRQRRGVNVRAPRLLTAVAAVCMLGATAAPAALGAGTSLEASAGHGASLRFKPKQISASSAFVLPPSKSCLRGNRLTLRIRALRRVRWVKAVVEVNGKRIAVIRPPELNRPVALEGLPDGLFSLSVTAKTSNRWVVTASRRYRSCSRSPNVRPAPKGTPGPDVPQEEGRQPPAGNFSPQGGSYSGRTLQAENIYFYVSADGNHLLDVSVQRVRLGCVPGKELTNHLEIGDVAINPDGSFAAKATQDGTLEGTAAKFTYTLSGQIQGTRASGILREDITYNHGTAYSCSSNNLSWDAVRESQGSQAGPAPIGAYSGRTLQAENIYFYVSADGNHLLDVSVQRVRLGCVPGKELTNHLEIGDVAINPDGSFAAKATQDGTLEGTAAKFTYTLSGHFHGFDSSGRARFAGILREDITYNNGTAYSCSSNNLSWDAVRS